MEICLGIVSKSRVWYALVMGLNKKKIWVVILGILLVVGLTGYLVFFDNQFFEDLEFSSDRQFSKEAVPIRPPVVNQFVGFNNPKELINEESPIAQDKKVYLKGELVEKTQQKIKIKTNTEVVEVLFSDELALRCEPEFFTDKDGNKVLAEKVFIDYSAMNIDRQRHVTSKIVYDLFEKGDQIILIATKEGKNLITKMIVGYGCETTRDLNL